MDKSIDLSKGDAAWDKHRTLDEKAVLGLGALAFCVIAALSIAARLGLEGHAAVETTLAAANVAPRSLAKGDILIPVTLSLKLENGKATLRGKVPDETSRATLLKRAEDYYGHTNVADRLDIQSGIVLTPWFDSVLKWFPPKVAEIRSGEISVHGMNVMLFGQVTDISARISAGRALAKLIGPEGQIVNDLQVTAAGQDNTPSSGGNR